MNSDIDSINARCRASVSYKPDYHHLITFLDVYLILHLVFFFFSFFLFSFSFFSLFPDIIIP